MIERTVAATTPISIAPLTLRTKRTIIKIRPNPKTMIGHPTSFPSSPRVTGTGPVPGVLRTNPASTSPINAMKRPIPTEIAILSCCGTARKTAVRNPVSTRTVMIIPSRTINPIASAQVELCAIPTATNVFRPRPVASANGKFASAPISSVKRPAISAVIAAIAAIFAPSLLPPR